jgi:hypothetical protein
VHIAWQHGQGSVGIMVSQPLVQKLHTVCHRHATQLTLTLHSHCSTSGMSTGLDLSTSRRAGVISPATTASRSPAVSEGARQQHNVWLTVEICDWVRYHACTKL